MSTLPANALCTRKEVKDYMNVVQADNTYDNLIHDFIGRVSSAFESYCSRNFIADDYTEYHDGEGKRNIFPNQFPINTIASIHDDVDWLWGSDTLIDPTDYRIAEDRYIVYNSVFGFSPQNVKLVYNAGYATIPVELTQACIEEVARKIKHRTDFDELVKTMGDGSVSYTDLSFLPQTFLTLDQFKLHVAL